MILFVTFSCNKRDNNNQDAIRRQAMENPEVQQILADPAMQMILQQMGPPQHTSEKIDQPTKQFRRSIWRAIQGAIMLEDVSTPSPRSAIGSDSCHCRRLPGI